MNVDEIRERLEMMDMEAALLFDDNVDFECYIVGGGAFILMGYAIRSTHDIDILEVVPKSLKKLFEKYDVVNDNVIAYSDNFPDGYKERAIRIMDTRKIKYYTLSLEDLVISKLCTTRGVQDLDDIENESVYKNIDWNILHKLAISLKSTMLSSEAYNNFLYNYKDYVRRFKSCED